MKQDTEYAGILMVTVASLLFICALALMSPGCAMQENAVTQDAGASQDDAVGVHTEALTNHCWVADVSPSSIGNPPELNLATCIKARYGGPYNCWSYPDDHYAWCQNTRSGFWFEVYATPDNCDASGCGAYALDNSGQNIFEGFFGNPNYIHTSDFYFLPGGVIQGQCQSFAKSRYPFRSVKFCEQW